MIPPLGRFARLCRYCLEECIGLLQPVSDILDLLQVQVSLKHTISQSEIILTKSFEEHVACERPSTFQEIQFITFSHESQLSGLNSLPFMKSLSTLSTLMQASLFSTRAFFSSGISLRLASTISFGNCSNMPNGEPFLVFRRFSNTFSISKHDELYHYRPDFILVEFPDYVSPLQFDVGSSVGDLTVDAQSSSVSSDNLQNRRLSLMLLHLRTVTFLCRLDSRWFCCSSHRFILLRKKSISLFFLVKSANILLSNSLLFSRSVIFRSIVTIF